MKSERPTICHVLHGLHVGGAELLAARLARRLRGDYRFVFACLDERGTLGAELHEEGFEVAVLGRSAGVDVGCVLRLARLLRSERVDLVHAHQYTPFFYAASARCLYPRPPVVFTEHGRHYPDYRRPKRIVANRFLLGRRDRVIGVGNAVRRALIANEGLPPRRVEVVYNGVDLGRFVNRSDDRAQARAEIGIGPSDCMLIQVARLDYLKDHRTALRALARVVMRCPQVRLVLVGDGPELGPVRLEAVRAGLADQVRLLGLRTDIPRLLHAADVFLLTSLSEGIPLTLIEAMAAGLPIVATRAGGVEEVVDDASANLAAVGDDRALGEHIVCLVGDAELRRRMGMHGRRRALSLFSETPMHARYVQVYQEAMAS